MSTRLLIPILLILLILPVASAETLENQQIDEDEAFQFDNYVVEVTKSYDFDNNNKTKQYVELTLYKIGSDGELDQIKNSDDQNGRWILKYGDGHQTEVTSITISDEVSEGEITFDYVDASSTMAELNIDTDWDIQYTDGLQEASDAVFIGQPNLDVTKSVSPAQVDVGGTVTVTIEAKNVGSVTATEIDITNPQDEGFVLDTYIVDTSMTPSLIGSNETKTLLKYTLQAVTPGTKTLSSADVTYGREADSESYETNSTRPILFINDNPKATPTATPTITTGVDITSIIGTIDSTASGVKTIAINVKLKPGSDDVDLSKTTIQYVDSDTLQDLAYGSSASGSNFAVSKIKDAGETSTYILNNRRDIYTILIDVSDVRGGSDPLLNGKSATIRITPAKGSLTTIDIQVPAILGSPGGRIDMSSEPKFTATPIPTPTITPTATPATSTATPIPELQDLSISVEPEEVEAAGGDVVNYTVRLNWFPKTWTGPVKIDLDVTGLGVSKQYTYDFFITKDMEPPIEAPINFQIPENAPPSTYEAEIVAKAPVKGGQPGEVTPMDWREDVLIAVAKIAIKVILSQSPGFLGITGLIGLFGAAFILKKK